MNTNKVSQSIATQSPEFLKTDYPLFNKFIEYYYRSQEKTGLGQNIVNNFLQYLDIDKLDISILGGATKIVEPITKTTDTIVVESVDSFIDTNGSILIGDEVIYYEKSTTSPNIALSPGISYDQVRLKWTGLAQLIDSFDGTTRSFPLTSQSSPVSSPSAQHLIVSVYGEVLIPTVDYVIEGTNIVFTTAPRVRTAGDDNVNTFITFLSGFVENSIVDTDDISGSFGENKTEFKITRNGVSYEPIADEYILAVYDNKLLEPKKDFFIDGDIFIFNEAPLNGRLLSLYSIEAPIPDFGSGAVGYARISDTGTLTGININQTGSGYQYKYPPKVSINSLNGRGAAASALVNGIKSVSLLDGGRGYSDTNPPEVVIQAPTTTDSQSAEIKAVVENGSITSLEIENSGSGYTFIPRVSFKQPGGAKIAPVTMSNGSISGGVTVSEGGSGYTTVPLIYVDEPVGENGIKAVLQAVLTDGVVTSVNVLNAGQGYLTTPRIAVINPTGAQVLETLVDSDGRVVSVELLSGGVGYEDVPSVYIVDNRTDASGTGATATASVFNGQITDINITNFGSGYSAVNPPTIIIQDPPQSKASVEIGLNQITGFSISKVGSGYDKAQFLGCARAASGIVNYTEVGNAVFSNNTVAATAEIDTEVKCLDALFVKRLLDKYIDQFLPDVPTLDYTKIDVRNAIKSVKDFYSTKGTSFSISYLFKLLYGEEVSVSYPKDQIIKPSDATWSIDTILRATLVSGDPENIKDGLLTQDNNIADPNISVATALIENFISIKTSNVELFELVLSEETIQGNFVVPYKTKLGEPLNTTDSIITVDSTIGWPERNGEFLIGNSELIQYKEKSLNQFIECTRSVNGVVEDWDAATEVNSNLIVYVNKGTSLEVVLKVVGIVDAQETTLTDTGSYYLSGDKLSVSKLGGTSNKPELTTWLYNVKKLLQVDTITYGGINNTFATVTCSNNHGLLVGDQVTIYGANPIVYNGTFEVTSRDTESVFQYQLPQPAEVVPQGNILVSVDLNKGKSDNSAVFNSIGPYTTNIQNSFFNDNYAYVASTGIPNYKIGPFPGSALLPGNQRKLNRFPLVPSTISIKNAISPGPIGTWINGTSVWSYKSDITKTFGPVTSINITDAGSSYDAAFPPVITISGGGGTDATAAVTVNGSITEIVVDNGGSGYTSSPLVSIVGGNGSGAAATAIVTKGVVSSILMNTSGTGYTSQPSITIVGGGGTGATATASVRGAIQSIAVTDGGASYTSKPSVTLSSGTGAVAQAIVSNGRIISIAIISAGVGYTTAPEVTIQGDGFGSVARATIDTDGENAGRVTNIEILNRGINYVQGTTIINLTSVGTGATFSPNIFEWTYNLQETTTVDESKGSVFAGFNNQYGGEYAHISNPQKLRYILGDNLFESITGAILEQETQLEHSPIIGWAFDGNPIYGPYGYSDPTDQSSNTTRLNSSYRLKTNLVYDGVSNPYPVRTAGPLLTEEVAGKFVEDYEYAFGLGDLDQYNGRFCKTPDFPEGRYCYFTTVDTTEAGNPIFPYVIGPSFNSIVDSWNLNKDAIQQNIPTGVVRYRDPYENVDIDVERAPNASTNALTTEGGDIILFEVEDENRDGIISQDETDDPDQLFEESPLQLFDYFPSVRFDSKVDIEVETTTKFEDASVTGFIIEDAGKNYQVDDILTFDNTDTDGIGASARVSRIKGESISSYNFEVVEDKFYGVLTTTNPHNLVIEDTVYVDYTPIMDNTNKQFVVRQLKGVEELIIEQNGSGYDVDIPPTIIIDGDGDSAELQAIVSSVGSIDTVNIINSGSGYVNNPRIILSHPQVFKKANYYLSVIENENYVKVNDVFVNDDKEVFFCGKTLDNNSNEVAFVSKFSELGVKEWEKTLESQDGETYTEFVKLDVNGDFIWVVGQNKPNSSLLAAYNPDIILAKYTQAIDGLSATLNFQKGYAGISGATRSDNITTIKRYSDSRYIIGGFTNTNSANPQDAFIASVDASGTFAAKRKLASVNGSEKITDLIVLDDAVYFVMETSPTEGSSDVKVSFGKVLIGTSVITVEWIKEINNVTYSFGDTSLIVDEFNEFYITSTLALKSNTTIKDSFWIGKLDTNGDLLWNYRYIAPVGNNIELASRSSIDIFGDLNIAYTSTNSTSGLKTVDTAKIGYNGILKKHTNSEFNANNIEGITVNAITVDNSGDVYAFGQTQWNRNEFVLPFTTGATQATDITGHYTPSIVETGDSVRFLADYAFIQGYQTASPSSWENATVKILGSELGTKLNDDWTLEFMIYKNGSEYQSFSQTQYTLVSIGDATDATGGLWLYYDESSGRLELVVTNDTTSINSAGGAIQSTQTTMYADNSWQFIGIKKEGNVFKVYVNSTEILTGTISDTIFTNKDIHFGNIPGRSTTTGQFRSNEQFQGYIDTVRLKNRAVAPTVPSDVTTIPPVGAYALALDWADDAWFATNTSRYDYIDYIGWGLKVDKDSDTDRLGDKGILSTTNIGLVRTAITPVTGVSMTVSSTGFALGTSGFQGLDFEDATTTMQEGTETLTYSSDIWSSRTATVPSPGSKKLKVSAVVKDRYYMKVTDTVKIDNIQELSLNQDFQITLGSKLVLNTDAGSFINSGYVIKTDTTNNKVYVAVNNNSWSDDLNTGLLSTEQFDEKDTYGIIGTTPSDVNVIERYVFGDIVNTTPGTFDIDLDDYNLDGTGYNAGGGQNLDSFAKFKPFGADIYSVQIVEVSGSTSFIPGSVVSITASDISFNTAKTTAQITNLTGVTKITLVATLDKVLQATSVVNTDEVYIITSSRHYLDVGHNILVDGNPSQTAGGTVYDEYDGSFTVDTVVSDREFVYKLPAAAQTDPAPNAANVSIFSKSPVLKMYYGHQYLFDLSHSSMLGANLSFSKDNLYKLEYSFNSIERIGTPGITGEGQPTPTVKFKVGQDTVTNISYYFDPSRTGADTPVDPSSYLDIVDSPYVGTFTISEVTGATITVGAKTMKFPLSNEPEGVATITNTNYMTSSKKGVGSIGQIRLVNSGGFYSRLPIVTGIESSRKIERAEISEPGTEYQVGTYNSVPISGDGEGGLVTIVVANGQTDEGVTIPGQIQQVTITSPGKGYTTAFIDIESIDGILGAGLTGSGAAINVVIPPFGTGAVIFTKGTNVGKIKKLKNNNFGYDYPHDYTLRPEITFPINAQLTSTSILDSITVTDPGSGYSQAPAIIITGGGGSGAIAEASIRNGRIEQILIKDPGAGYSSAPTVSLKSSFNYVVNLDLGLLQFAFPHGIVNGSAVTLNVVDTGDGIEFPLASGAVGRLNGNTTYYAITGTANSLDGDQLKLAITPANAELGDAITFANAGTGRQQVLTESFGAAAEANVITSTFLEGEMVYQGDSLENATATGFVSTNQGWQVGPRILKVVDYTGVFSENQKVTGVISKSSGVISDLNIAKGVLEIGPITKTTGQFIDDVGKPSEIIQKIQDSYYYQDFSYAVKSSVSIDDWKDILIKNVHPASFKVFGELNLGEYGYTANREIDFELTKSVELAREATVPNIQNFALAEPIYSEFNNTEVLFRQRRLTSSENILTSVVQRLDDMSNLFDGERTQFPLTVNGENVIANANQLLVVLNGVAQTPDASFEVQGDSIIFSEPPSPPASVKYVSVGIQQIATVDLEFSFTSGIFPNVGNTLIGITSGARLTVTNVIGDTIRGFVTEGTFVSGEQCQVGATGFSGTLQTIDSGIYSNGLFVFNEQITNLDGDLAVVETINLETGQETPIAKLRYGIGASTTNVEVVSTAAGVDTPVPIGTFVENDDYQIASEIVTVTSVTNGSDSTTIVVTRGQLGTAATSHQEDTPMYSTDIEVTNDLTLSKTAGTYQSTPGLFNIQLNDVIIGAQSGVVARITSTSAYQDPITQEFIEQVNISSGSSFFGLLFNRLTSISYPNKIIDDISNSQVSIVDFTDNVTAFNADFPNNESISNNIVIYDNETGEFTDDEFIRNYRVLYGGNTGDFSANENMAVRKLTFTDLVGGGFFSSGQIIRTADTKAEIIGYSQARNTLYLGKIGRSQSTGQDYHTASFVAGAQLNTANSKFGSACLALSKGTSAHSFVSGVDDAIIAGGGATGSFTAATGTTYNPFTGDMVITIGTHTLTTSNTVTIVDDGIVFTCGSDNNTNNYAYPRATDPASGSALAITAETDTTITVNVGPVPIDEYLTIPTSTEFGFASGDFTVETWIKLNSVAAGGKTIFDMRSGATELAPYLYVDGANIKYYNNGSVTITGATTLVVDTWYHVAISRSGTDTKLFLNGTQEGGTYSDASNYGSTKPIRIGADYAGSAVTPGYFDDFRVSNSARYTATFTAPTGMFHGDANTKLLLHFDGTNGQTYTQDWSGTESFTDGEEFNNDAITGSTRQYGGLHQFVSATTNAITIDSANKTPTDATYDSSTGLLVLTIGSHSYTTSSTLTIAANSLTFTCDKDNYVTNHTYPRSTDPSFGVTLDVTAVSGTTVTVNVGTSPRGFANKTHRYYDAATAVLKNIDLLSEEGDAVATAASPYQLDYSTAAAVYGSSDSVAYDYFGSSVAVSDDGTTNKMVVGAYQDDDDAENSGSAYIFDLNGGSQVKITAGSSNAGQNDTFGYSVAVNNNKVAVGAPSDSDDGTNSGSVYIFNADGTNRIKVTASDAAASNYFGHSVAIDGNYLVVGAYGNDSSKGAVYRFDLDGTNELKIVASDAATGDELGHSVAIGNNKIVTGAPYDDDTASATGSVYVFDLDGTNQVKINHTSPAENDRFGWHVAIGENKIAVGAKYRNNAYIYDLDGTNEVVLSSAGTDGTGGNFGASVAVNQGKVFVGAPIRSITNGSGIVQPSAGKIYAYDLDGTNQLVLNSTEQGSQYDYLGDDFALAVGDNRVIAGSKFADPNNAESAGEIFVWNYTQSLSTTNFALTYKSVLTELIEDMRNGSNSHIWDISAGLVDRTVTPVSGIVGYSTVDDNQLLTGLQTIQGHMSSIINYIPITITGSHGLTQFTDATVTDSSYTTLTTLTPSTVSYTPENGNMVLTFGTPHALTTSDYIRIAPGSLKFTCTSDGDVCVNAYPRATDPVHESTIKIDAFTTNTFTVNVGASPVGQQYPHTFVSADTDAVTVLNYSTSDCADVVSTVNNLLDIVEDTISEAIGTTTNDANADHIATITKVDPIVEFVGGTVDAYYEVPFTSSYHDATNDYVYAHSIGADDRYRFRDAANLIRANASVIVDKASADMLSRYPDLASTMPRNVGGGTAGTERCKTDLAIIVGEIANDIEYGGNDNTITAAKFYLNTINEIQHIRLQVWQSAYAHERLGYYMKQAINGDLDYTNTDNIITGDWGITNDSGQCANVQTAIDNLIDAINDLIAPTGLDYNTAADRLYFNRGYIAEEIVGTSATNLGLLGTELRYSLNSGTFTAATYTRTVYSGYIQDLIVAMISDLQTGGNNSTITQMQKFLTTDLKIITIDNELYTFFFANEQIRTLGEKAIKNLLYDRGTNVTSPQYAAAFTNNTAYRDSITPTDIDTVSCRMRELLDTALNTLFPGKIEARSAVKNILFNENYYKQEIAASVNNQFGQDSWVYNSFVEDIVNNIEYDFITSNTTDTQVAYTLTFSSFYGTFIAGETITNGSTTATVLYSSGSTMIIGSLVGTIFADDDSITAPSGASATIGENGVSVVHEWYNDTSNVKTIETASAISSLIEGSIIPTNLWTTPEQFDSNWTTALTEVSVNTGTSPDNTITSEKIAITETTGQHHIQRSYSLTSFDTFDSDGSKFDSGSLKFDSGAVNPTQTFTSSMFVKASEYNNVRFTVFLDSGTENAHFNANLTTGQIGSIFTTSGLTVTGHGAIPFGNGWYRLFITTEFGFGFATLVNKLNILSNTTALLDFTGTANDIKLTPALANNSQIGRTAESMSSGNGKVVIGAGLASTDGLTSNGTVYVYDQDGSNQVQLFPGVKSSFAYFGNATSIGNSKIAIGAYGETMNGLANAGRVYIYDLDGGNEVKIDMSTSDLTQRANDYFGQSVAIFNNKVYIGANGWSGAANNQAQQGAVCVYDLSGNFEYSIQASDAAASDRFGFSVAAGNGKVAVGALGETSSTGAVYVYDAADGANEVKFTHAGSSTGDQFGYGVVIGDNKIGVFSPNMTVGGNAARGGAWVFDLDGTNEVELTPVAGGDGGGAAGIKFGHSMTIDNGKVAVGAPNDQLSSGGVATQGLVFLYDLDGTNGIIESAFDANVADLFGSAVTLISGNLYIAASGGDDQNSNAGSIYLLDITGGPGVFAWGAKLSNEVLGTYVAVSGQEFYANVEYNIKKFTLDLLQDFFRRALDNDLISPSPTSGFYKFYDSTAGANYDGKSVMGFIRSNIDIIEEQLKSSNHYTNVDLTNSITIQTKSYGTRDIPVGISGELIGSDYFYSLDKDTYAEIQTIAINEAKVAKAYKRFRIDGNITDGPFTMNEVVQKQGDGSITGIVYGFYEDENYKYLDVAVTAGTWSITDIIEGATNTTTAQVSAIENRLHVINVRGSFEEDISFKGYTSTESAQPISYTVNQSAVTNNTGGILTVDTETLLGSLETTSVVYPESSREYLEVKKYAGLDISVGDRIASIGYLRLTVSVDATLDLFQVGNKLYRMVSGGVQDTSVYGTITEVDLDNNYIYVTPIQGSFNITDIIGDFGLGETVLQGTATVSNRTTVAGAASGLVQDVRDVGLSKRLYLTNVIGTFTGRDGLRGPQGYRSSVLTRKILKARVKRFFRGFDGVQTTFNLTTEKGTQYLPDPAGHMLIFINGILQPPGAGAAYTAFSDKIQFSEPPDIGSSFTGFYIGKLRQLDDISFEFDSLRQSFNLRRDEIFYSLTLTDGVQSSTIRPENNIIVSINGVLQEPGVGFEIVGSRIIFSEIPRFGSTFVAFSYVGSEADVDADVVVPPVEAGDFIDIQGEVSDREVAVIESSNSLITFDYLGSVFGQNAQATANLTSGFIEKVQITAGGSGYTSRPTVRLDSISGFEGQVRALIGVAGVTVTDTGTGYQNPDVNVETTVPDDWTAPDISLYGEEVIDPEVIP